MEITRLFRLSHNLIKNRIGLIFFIGISCSILYGIALRGNAESIGWKFMLKAPVATHKSLPKIFRSVSFNGSSVYFSGLDNNTYALNVETGKVRWRHEEQNYSIYGSEFDETEQMYVTNFDGNLYAIHKNTGEEKWRFTTPDRTKIDTEPVITGTDVLFGSRNGVLYSVNKFDGSLNWSFKTKPIDKSVYKNDEVLLHFGRFVTDESYIYLNSATERMLFALDIATGKVIWQIKLDSYYFTKPILYRNTLLYKNSDSEYILLDKKNGKVVLHIEDLDESLYVGKTCIYTVTAGIKTECINPENGIRSWLLDDSYTTQTSISEISPSKTIITYTNVNSTIVKKIHTANGKEEWSQSFAYPQLFKIYSIDTDILLVGQRMQCRLSDEGRLRWCTTVTYQDISAYINKNGMYVVSRIGKDIGIDYVDVYTGKNIWTYRTDDYNTDSFQEHSGSLYFLDKENTNIIKLNSKFRNHSIKGSALQTVDSGQGIYSNFLIFLTQFKIRIKPKVLTVDSPQKFVDKNSVFEITLHTNRPFRLENQINTKYQMVLISPKGNTHAIQGFYYDLKTWKFRFTPTDTGVWRWSLEPIRGIAPQSQKGSFLVLESTKPDFLKISSVNPKYFSGGNGNIFLPIGIQNCVTDLYQDGTPLDSWPLDITEYQSENTQSYRTTSLQHYASIYASSGFNMFRWGAGNCSFTLWDFDEKGGVGPYINEGIFLDEIFAEFKKNKFRIWASLLSFELPFDAAIPIQNQKLFLKKYLDYAISRYAAYVDVWELSNEVKLNDDLIHFMTSYIKKIDPYKHPITTSWERPELHDIEVTSYHWYSGECNEFCDQELGREIDKYTKYDKPLVFSEQGNNYANWDPSSPSRFRVRLWISFLRQASMIYWNMPNIFFENKSGPSNIYIGPQERLYTSVFSKITDETGTDMQSIPTATKNNSHKAYAVSTGDTIYGYIYTKIFDPPKTSSTISLTVASDGVVQWISPENGNILSEKRIVQGTQEIESPEFTTDIIFKFKK